MASPASGVCGDDSCDGGEMGPERPAPLHHEIVERIQSGGEGRRVRAAMEIRLLTKASPELRRQLSWAVEPLVGMLRSGSLRCSEAALLALPNLAAKNERNKTKIVDAGALEPLTSFLQSTNTTLQEHATAAILTLSASSINKPRISTAGAIPLLVTILRDGNRQARIDAVMTLYNLSTLPDNLHVILSVKPIPPLVSLLKICRKSSKTAEICCALLESLLVFDEGRTTLTAQEGGVLALVEVLEEGSLQGREHAVGGLLTMCVSDRRRYREVILKEGVIPGLLELTVQGTPKSQSKAHALLQLLRNSPSQRKELQTDTLEAVVHNIVSHADGEDRAEKAKKILSEMVQVHGAKLETSAREGIGAHPRRSAALWPSFRGAFKVISQQQRLFISPSLTMFGEHFQ